MMELNRPDRLYAGYVLDLDGTVYLDDQPIPGVSQAIAALRGAGSRVVFLTNKPLERPAAYALKLSQMGIPAGPADVVSSIDALVAYLAAHPPAGAILPVTEPLLWDVLTEAGHTVTHEPVGAAMVVVSWDRTFDYDKLERAFHAVRGGARLVATNPDPFCPGPGGGQPDCAAMLAAIEACTGAKAEAVVGKPSSSMAAAVIERLGLEASEVAMVGDRLATDVRMAREAGMVAVLVLSGATGLTDLEDIEGGPDRKPDFVLEDLVQLIPMVPLEGAR
jgi:HAD superfamily hydrolase (TIGR01450 family)